MDKKEYISKGSLLILILSFPISFTYFCLLRAFASEKFYLDTGTIRRFMKPGSPVNDYSIAGDFYKRLGFHWNTPILYEILFSALIFFLFTFLILFILKIDLANISSFIFYGASLVFFGPYFSMISKDLIVLVFLLLSLIFFNSKYYPFIFTVFATIYAVNYRKYWLITIVLTVCLYYICNHVKRKKLLAIVSFEGLYLIIISIVYHFSHGGFLSSNRMSINMVRENGLYSRTMTRTILPPVNVINDILNSLYNGINLIIPIDGFGSINEIVYYIWLYVMIFFIWNVYRKCRGIRGNMLYYLLFFVSFIFTQSLFEPDMGSAFRHQLTVTLFIPFMLQSYQQNYFEETSHIDLKNDKITK